MLSSSELTSFRNSLRGQVLVPVDAAYEAARPVWNAMIDRRPAVIAQCANTQDVVTAVNVARDKGLLLAVRGGGHNIAGKGTVDGGFLIDLASMNDATVDVGARRVTVGGGARLADVDTATQEHGLAVPLGINSTTGIGGLTLGGGFGWFSRAHGMTIDNLVSAEVVTADGNVITASATGHPDLFWALKGGSGNFGVVTRFTFELHPLGPNVLSGLVVYPLSEAKSVLQRYREFVAEAPDDLSVWVVLRKAPPLPFLPEQVHGTEMIALAIFYAGDPAEGETLIAPLRRFGTPLGEHIGTQPYIDWQKAFDPLLAPGARNYWKSHNFTGIDDRLIDLVVDYVGRLPSPHCEIFFASIGGATTRPAPGAAAYSHRDALYVMNVHGRWETAAEDAACVAWCRDYFQATARYASGGVYVNFMTEDEGDRVRAAYGPNYDRLAAVKKTYDPHNLFRVNQNIKPA